MNETHTPAIDQQLMVEEAQVRMSDSVYALPPDLRDIYELWATGDYSYEDIARQMNEPIGTVRARLRRAARLLKLSLSESAEDFFVEGSL